MSHTTDDAIFAIYNDQLIALSRQADIPKNLSDYDLSARAISPICGSEVEVFIKHDNGVVTDFGFDVEACALTKTVVAVMARAIVGQTVEGVIRVGQQMEKMLDTGDVVTESGWEDLNILKPVKDYKARHNAILLPFEAVTKAFQK